MSNAVKQWLDQLLHHYQDDLYQEYDFSSSSSSSSVAEHVLKQLVGMDGCFDDVLEWYIETLHPLLDSYRKRQQEYFPMAVLAAYEYIFDQYNQRSISDKNNETKAIVVWNHKNRIQKQFVNIVCYDIHQHLEFTHQQQQQSSSKKKNPIPLLLQLLGHVICIDHSSTSTIDPNVLEPIIWIILYFCACFSDLTTILSLPNLSLESWMDSQTSSSHDHYLPKPTGTSKQPLLLLYSSSSSSSSSSPFRPTVSIPQVERDAANNLLQNKVLPTIRNRTSTATMTSSSSSSVEDAVHIVLDFFITQSKDIYGILRSHFFQHTKRSNDHKHNTNITESSPVSNAFVMITSLQMISYLSTSSSVPIGWEHVIPMYYTILDYQYECRPSFLRVVACHLFHQQLLQQYKNDNNIKDQHHNNNNNTFQQHHHYLQNTHLLLKKIFPTTVLPTLSEEEEEEEKKKKMNDDSQYYAHYLCQLWSQIVIFSPNHQWKQEAFEQMCLVIQKCTIQKRRTIIIKIILIGGISPLLQNMMDDNIMELGRIGLQTLLPLLQSYGNNNDDSIVPIITCICLYNLLLCAHLVMEHHGGKIMTCLLHKLLTYDPQNHEWLHSLFRSTAAMALLICGTRAEKLCHTILTTTNHNHDDDDDDTSTKKLQSLKDIVKDIQSHADEIQQQVREKRSIMK